jgi:protein gp37
MSSKSTIEWTESTWNPVTGCTKISEGCKNCYAERMAKRLQAMGNKNYIDGFKLKLHQDQLALPFQWKKPRTIFVNSMSDLFHKDVPDYFIFKVFDVMRQANWHNYQILTKRSARLLQLSSKIKWPPNVWMGVTVENDNYINRIDDLRKTKAIIKFISFEPLLGPANDLDLNDIDWVIVGGESGPKARAIKESWIIDIKDQCNLNNITFFFKQWGGVNKKKTGRKLLGKYWNGVPKPTFQYT